MEKLKHMNLYKDFFMVIVPGLLAGAIAVVLHKSPSVLLAQVDWAGEVGRLIHALTEPGVVSTVVAGLGALARYEIWKRRLRKRHEQELASLRKENRDLREQLNGTDKS